MLSTLKTAQFLAPASRCMHRVSGSNSARRRSRHGCASRPTCKEGGMYVPSDRCSTSFGGMSPERKAAHAMIAFFTFVAVRVVLAQLEGSGRGALGSYNAKATKDLTALLEEMPIKDGDAWIEALMARNDMLGVRIMEVRAAYAKEDFEWTFMEKISVDELVKRNTSLMRKHASLTYEKAFQAGESQKDGQ